MVDYSKDYLNGKYGAVPNISKAINWDEVYASFSDGFVEFQAEMKAIFPNCAYNPKKSLWKRIFS